jgi:hypothetical protein
MPERDSPVDEQADDVFRWAGRLRDEYVGVEWAATPLGPTLAWPQSLRTALSICLGNALPSVIAWGPDLTLLYNEAFVPILGDKHPDALGASHPQVFWETWDTTGPAIAEVIATGVGTVYPDVLLPLRRHGIMQDCYFNYGRSPLADESRAIAGVFSVVVETTERVCAERGLREQTERLGILQRLTQHLAATMTDAEIARVVLSEARPLLGASVGGVTKVVDGWAEHIPDSPLSEDTDNFQRRPLDARLPTTANGSKRSQSMAWWSPYLCWSTEMRSGRLSWRSYPIGRSQTTRLRYSRRWLTNAGRRCRGHTY